MSSDSGKRLDEPGDHPDDDPSVSSRVTRLYTVSVSVMSRNDKNQRRSPYCEQSASVTPHTSLAKHRLLTTDSTRQDEKTSDTHTHTQQNTHAHTETDTTLVHFP